MTLQTRILIKTRADGKEIFYPQERILYWWPFWATCTEQKSSWGECWNEPQQFDTIEEAQQYIDKKLAGIQWRKQYRADKKIVKTRTVKYP